MKISIPWIATEKKVETGLKINSLAVSVVVQRRKYIIMSLFGLLSVMYSLRFRFLRGQMLCHCDVQMVDYKASYMGASAQSELNRLCYK